MYIKFRFILFLFMPVIFMSCAGSKKTKYKRLPGTWQESKVTIDGSNKDWPSPYPEYDEKASLGYCVSNDKENLYITVETGDLATQLKILRNGLTVWIDKTGKKEEITAINFPIPQDYVKKTNPKGKGKEKAKDTDNLSKPPSGHFEQTQVIGNGDSKQKKRLVIEDRVKSALKAVNAYSLQGFKGCNLEFPLLEKDTCGIVARIAIDSENELVWEAVVPFKSFYYKKEISKLDKGRPISVCFETTGSPRPPDQPGYSGNGGGGGFRPGFSMGMGGGMMMGGGGMMGRSRGSQQSNTNNNEMESLYKSTKTYKVFGVAWVEQKN